MQNIEQEAIRLIQLKLKEKGLNSSILARKMGMHPSSVAKMMQTKQIKLSRLKEISDLVGYNFLRALADQLEINDPPKLTEDHTACQLRIRELEIENAVLMKVLGK
jgi:DNA-binding Xre family transcriptional regulator